MSFPRYPEYKDSGVAWLGEVPAHWEVTPVKAVASCNDDVLDEAADEDFEIEYVEISGVSADRGIVETSVLPFGKAPSRARRRVRHGDTLVSTVRTYLRAIASVKMPAENLIASTGFAVIRPRAVDPEFLGYLFHSEYLISEVIARSVGVSYPAINASELMRLVVPLPSVVEQVAIATFLDRETAKIDALVAEQEKLIALLKEKRQAVISHAVTQGLDPNVPMKDSGIEWLGEVPATWEIWKLAHAFGTIGSGTTPPSGEHHWYEDGTIPWVTTGELSENIISETAKCVTPAALDQFTSLRLHPAGSLAMAMYGATIGRLGILGVEATTNQACCVLGTPIHLDIKFTFYWLQGLKQIIIELFS